MIDGALASSDGITFTFTARRVWDWFHDEMERCGETLKAHLKQLLNSQGCLISIVELWIMFDV